MHKAVSAAIATVLSLAGTAAFSQGQNPGISTTPGLSQPTTPSTPQVTVTNIQNLPVGPQPSTNGVGSSLQFSNVNVTAPVAIPSRFGTSNVLTTVSPTPTIAQPLPSVSNSSSSTTITPAPTSFTFTPSPTFVPVSTPRPYQQPYSSGFVAK